MAFDTQNQRHFMVGLLPVADGSFNLANAQHMLGIFPSRAEIVEVDFSSSGAAVSTGMGSSLWNCAASVVGVATTAFVAAALCLASVSSAGVSTVSGIGSATSSSVGSSAGEGVASGIGASTATTVSASTGVGEASSIGSSAYLGVASSTGEATVLGEGEDAAGVGGITEATAESVGVGTATSISGALKQSLGESQGISSVWGDSTEPVSVTLTSTMYFSGSIAAQNPNWLLLDDTLRWMGEWADTHSYDIDDVVIHKSTDAAEWHVFISKTGHNVGNTPTSSATNWRRLYQEQFT